MLVVVMAFKEVEVEAARRNIEAGFLSREEAELLVALRSMSRNPAGKALDVEQARVPIFDDCLLASTHHVLAPETEPIHAGVSVACRSAKRETEAIPVACKSGGPAGVANARLNASR
jgi:hypothetical protein